MYQLCLEVVFYFFPPHPLSCCQNSTGQNLPKWGTSRFVSIWKYSDWLELDSYPVIADITTYKGGGFTAVFGNRIEEDYEMLDYIIDSNWMDQQTRAVFLEFVLYNPTLNGHVMSQMLVEFPPTGGKLSLFLLV